MKKTLTLLALMIAVVGAGQRTDWNIDTLPGRPIYDTLPKYDTLPILYLYADTAGVRNVYDTLANGWIRINELGVFWDFGYEVRERKLWIDAPGTYCTNCPPYTMEHITYLDRHKNPIRKSIVIFMTKTIEKWQPR